MKKVDIERIFNKLSLQVRSTGHNYGWLTVNDKKILRVHYTQRTLGIWSRALWHMRTIWIF